MDIAGVNVSIPFAFADEPLFQQPARAASISNVCSLIGIYSQNVVRTAISI
jgi:hypothetical protein